MKIRANLGFFLSKKGGNLESFCKRNGIKTRQALLEFLDDVSVTHPDPRALALLFPEPVKSPAQPARVRAKKSSVAKATEEKAKEVSGSKSKSSRSSRRRTRRVRSASASEE